jgi:hypothetical protein
VPTPGYGQPVSLGGFADVDCAEDLWEQGLRTKTHNRLQAASTASGHLGNTDSAVSDLGPQSGRLLLRFLVNVQRAVAGAILTLCIHYTTLVREMEPNVT